MVAQVVERDGDAVALVPGWVDFVTCRMLLNSSWVESWVASLVTSPEWLSSRVFLSL